MSSYQDLLDRVTALEGKPITLADLPIASLLDQLSDSWLPDLLTNSAVNVTSAERLRIVRGRVSSVGAVVVGAGFTASRTGLGNYIVTFATPFTALPVAAVTPGASLNGAPTTTAASLTVLLVTDASFDFIVVGPT